MAIPEKSCQNTCQSSLNASAWSASSAHSADCSSLIPCAYRPVSASWPLYASSMAALCCAYASLARATSSSYASELIVPAAVWYCSIEESIASRFVSQASFACEYALSTSLTYCASCSPPIWPVASPTRAEIFSIVWA